MEAAAVEIEANGGVDNYVERPEWDLTREYRGKITEVTGSFEAGQTPKIVLVVQTLEPTEFTSNRAWLTYWMSPKALPYSMKDLTKIFMKAGVSIDQLDIENVELVGEQLVDQTVIFSLQAGRNPAYPERRFVNPDFGRPPKGPGTFTQNLTVKEDRPALAAAGGAPEPFPAAPAAPVAPAAPALQSTTNEVVQSVLPSGAVIVDVVPEPQQVEETVQIDPAVLAAAIAQIEAEKVAAQAPPSAETAPVGTGVGAITLPPGLG
jgi:hypothetical protein